MGPSPTAEQFEHHRQRLKELQAQLDQIKIEISNRLAVMEALARLEPSLANQMAKPPLRAVESVSPARQLPSPTVVDGRRIKGLGGLQTVMLPWAGHAMRVSAVVYEMDSAGIPNGGARPVRRLLDKAVELGFVELLDDPKDRRTNLYRWIPGKTVAEVFDTEPDWLLDNEMDAMFDQSVPGDRVPGDAPGQ